MKNPTILYIDDNPDHLNIFRGLLRPTGLSIITESNGTRGSKLYEQQTPDLVFLDIGMPGISGFVVLRRIRKFAEDNNLHVKIIMLTGRYSREDFEKAIEYGADDYLLKPMEPEKIVAKIKKCFPRFEPPPIPADGTG